MKLRTTLTSSFLIFGILISLFGGISYYQLSILSSPLNNEIPLQIKELQMKSDLDAHAQLIRYYDEVLTQSARNYAFTLDEKWKQRYFETIPLLDAAILYSIEYGNETEQTFFQSVNTSNLILIEMEEEAIALATNGNSEQSIEILQSAEYWEQKTIYEKGLRDYVTSRGLEYDDALIESSHILEQTTKNTQEILAHGIEFVVFFIVSGISSSIFLGILISKSITKPLEHLTTAANELAKGKSDTKIRFSSSQNEIARLIRSFNIMSNVREEKKRIQQEIEQMKLLNKEKDEFLSIVSHELRTPILPIKGNCEILLDENFTDAATLEQRKFIESIVVNSKRLDGLIDKILLTQKLDLNKYQFAMESVESSILIDDIMQSYKTIMEQKNIQFVNSINKNFNLFCDENALHEIFTNLINNAMGFVSKENGIIELGAEKKYGLIEFFVKDNGVGISTEKQKKIFDKFYQLDSSHTRTHGGLGLGLSICQKLVLGMGGSIRVVSEEGKGTTFYFTVRRNEIENSNN